MDDPFSKTDWFQRLSPIRSRSTNGQTDVKNLAAFVDNSVIGLEETAGKSQKP